MPEKDEAPVQGDLLKALDDLTELIQEQEQRGRVWSDDQEADEDEFAGFEFDTDEEDPVLLDESALVATEALPSQAEIETLVQQVLSRRIAELREEVTRELMLELRKRYPGL